MNNPLPSPFNTPARKRKLAGSIVTLAHGGGGKAMRDLIDDIFIDAFANESLNAMEDQARFDLDSLACHGSQLAFTTDSYVVDPLMFPGGDIGKLAVCGTVNDLAVGGATPLYLTCAVIIEEGMPFDTLREIVQSMARTCLESGVKIVTGDTKVVNKGSCDKLFVNTAGIGVIPPGIHLSANLVRPGDAILVNGMLGDHGATILNARGDMALSTPLESDCAPLHGLIRQLLDAAPGTRFIRDATRGGLASVLNEVAESSRTGIEIVEDALPLRAEVKGVCEILGLDPLYLANEGKIVCIVPEEEAASALAAMRTHEYGREAARIGQIQEGGRAGRVIMKTVFGGSRIVDMLIGEQLPRIC